MPPDGYDTVTLPSSLVQRIDELSAEMGVESRTAVLRGLISDYRTTESDTGDSGPVTLEPTEYGHIADELEQRLR